MRLYQATPRDYAAMAGGFLAALVGLHLALGTPIDPESALLNKGTAVVFESDSGVRIHCRDVRDYKLCLDGHHKRGGPLALWLGNSQLHAINQLQPGQLGAPLMLHRYLRARNVDLLTFSYGNANLQEHAVQYVYLNAQRPISTLIVALVYDDTREDGVRDDVQPFLADSAVRAVVRQYPIGVAWTTRDTTTRDAVTESVQSRLERWLDARASAASTVWRQRSEIAYQYFVWQRRIRNWVFRVKPETVRKRIPSVYEKNMAALDLMLAEAARNGTRVLLYIAPLRQDVPIPYVASEYQEFKAAVRERAARYASAQVVDLDSIVPPPMWGLKDATSVGGALEMDYMHFTSAGHEVLAARLRDLLFPRFVDRAVQ